MQKHNERGCSNPGKTNYYNYVSNKMKEQLKNSGKGCLITLGFRRLSRRGQSVIEFAALIMFILTAFLVFQKYISRGLSGRWKGVGDALGQGRIYDPNYTIECEFYPGVGWYDRTCYENTCRSSTCPTPSQCTGCLSGCKSSFCD